MINVLRKFYQRVVSWLPYNSVLCLHHQFCATLKCPSVRLEPRGGVGRRGGGGAERENGCTVCARYAPFFFFWADSKCSQVPKKVLGHGATQVYDTLDPC